jgi:hypothetical protein
VQSDLSNRFRSFDEVHKYIGYVATIEKSESGTLMAYRGLLFLRTA